MALASVVEVAQAHTHARTHEHCQHHLRTFKMRFTVYRLLFTQAS